MSAYILSHFLIYSIINAFTPGPGNILALNTVTHYGWQKGKPLFFGIFAGYYVVQALCAVLVFSIGTLSPTFTNIIKYIGAIYILWLAFYILFSKPGTATTDKSASFTQGFILQFVNIKIYLFGITALTGFIIQYSHEFSVLLFFEMVIATIGTIATLTWIGAGLLLQQIFIKYYKIINVVLALLLLECVYSILKFK